MACLPHFSKYLTFAPRCPNPRTGTCLCTAAEDAPAMDYNTVSFNAGSFWTRTCVNTRNPTLKTQEKRAPAELPLSRDATTALPARQGLHERASLDAAFTCSCRCSNAALQPLSAQMIPQKHVRPELQAPMQVNTIATTSLNNPFRMSGPNAGIQQQGGLPTAQLCLQAAGEASPAGDQHRLHCGPCAPCGLAQLGIQRALWAMRPSRRCQAQRPVQHAC
jgi:hypothetical protein